jgi:hypothetical protein
MCIACEKYIYLSPQTTNSNVIPRENIARRVPTDQQMFPTKALVFMSLEWQTFRVQEPVVRVKFSTDEIECNMPRVPLGSQVRDHGDAN